MLYNLQNIFKNGGSWGYYHLCAMILKRHYHIWGMIVKKISIIACKLWLLQKEKQMCTMVRLSQRKRKKSMTLKYVFLVHQLDSSLLLFIIIWLRFRRSFLSQVIYKTIKLRFSIPYGGILHVISILVIAITERF